jgi:membrane protease YdiL (CAAX protease family)
LTELPSEERKDRLIGWKTLGYLALAYAVMWGVTAVWGVGVTAIGRRLGIDRPIRTTITMAGMAAAHWAAWSLGVRLVLKRRLCDIAFRRHPGWWADLLFGAGLTALALYAIFLIGVRTGWLVVERWLWDSLSAGELAGRVWLALVTSAMAGIFEEIMGRGYLLSGLKAAWGAAAGVIISSAIFGLWHLIPYGVEEDPARALVLVIFPVLVGALFAWMYLRTGALWLPISVHFVWDVVEVDLFNLSGDPTSPSLFGALTQAPGPSWLAGVDYGGALWMDTLALAIIAGGVWLWLRARRGLEEKKQGA